jgi:LysR family transcriptional regulator, nitrogen assimilation regulatory protein
MDLRQLTAVVAVAEVGSITKAAKLLHLVQPSVTRQIRLLEEELGVPLFERGRNGMTPTAAGRIMVERARRAILELETARVEIHPSTVAGTITIGLLESCLDLLSEPLVDAVASRYPDVELRVLTAYSGQLQDWLDAGVIDLSLLYNLSSTLPVTTVPLLHDGLWAVAPPEAGLTPDQPLTCAELVRHPLVLPAHGHGLRSLIEREIFVHHPPTHIAMQVNALALQKRLVRAGHGWTVLPAVSVAREVAAGTLSATVLVDPEIRRRVVLGFQRDYYRNVTSEPVAVEMKRVILDLVADGSWTGGTIDPDVT